jgi:two-component system sensor histidine kinase KdpD
MLQNFITQIASTLEREQLNEIARKSIAFVESERLYKTLFNSLSHELRTPIAAIVSASESLLDEKTSGQPSVRTRITSEIHAAADRLNRLIDNLLDMTRLESGRIKPVLDWCDLNDLINASLKKLHAELASHTVMVEAASDLPLVKLDFGLVEQAITNLLHNAALYTPPDSTIKLRASADADECIIVVADNGSGFPKEALARAFEKFYRVPGTRAGGAGLGLSIAQGFVQAHGGSITVENAKEGGAQFTMRFPIQKEVGKEETQ